jgi:adenylate cyclase class IV
MLAKKTIRRDKDEIKTRNAKKLTPEESLALLAELTGKMTETTENLMRLARDNKASVQEKAQAGMYAYKGIEGQIAILQKLGFAPSKPLLIEAEVHHHQDEDVSVDQVKADLFELEKMAEAKDRKDPEILKLIETAKQQLALAEAKNTVAELRDTINQSQGNASEPGQ